MANSGLFLRGNRAGGNPAYSGCEIQILDDHNWEKVSEKALRTSPVHFFHQDAQFIGEGFDSLNQRVQLGIVRESPVLTSCHGCDAGLDDSDKARECGDVRLEAQGDFGGDALAEHYRAAHRA